jgi:hypothetical protein
MTEATTGTAGQSGTLRSWLAAVTPPPPPSLATRLATVLEPFADRPAREVPECCLEAGEGLLDAILASGSTSRDTALDLLTVDALITYAFQEAAGTPERLEARASRAMERIAAIPGREPS